MRIRRVVEGAPLTATLDDGAAPRDFAALLPLALVLEDSTCCVGPPPWR